MAAEPDSECSSSSDDEADGVIPVEVDELRRLNELATLLNETAAMLATKDEGYAESARKVLALSVARLVQALGIAPSKIDELLVATRYEDVNQAIHGSDGVDEEGYAVEIKKSTTTAKRSFKTDITWRLAAGATPDERKTNTLASLAEKMTNAKGEGYALYYVYVGRAIEPARTYKLSYRFLVEYFSRLKYTSANDKNKATVNMSVARCKVCGEWHKFVVFVRASYNLAHGLPISDRSWQLMLSQARPPIASQCKPGAVGPFTAPDLS